MGREYRDELRSAHERIARLEEELARERAPKAPRDRGWLVGLAIGGFLLVAFFGAFAFVFVRAWSAPHPIAAPVTVAPVETSVPKVSARYYAQREMPLRADVDGDGKKELVGLFWSGTSQQEPLWVAALDPVTFEPKWATGPYRAQWAGTRTHLALAGEFVLLSDSQETLHVLALADGKELSHESLPGGVTQMCPSLEGANHVRVRVGDGIAPADVRIFDVKSRALTKARDDLPCGGFVPTCDDRNQDVCEGRGRGELPPPAERTDAFGTIFGSGERRVAIGYDRDGALPMIGWRRGAKSLDWRSADVVLTGDVRHFGAVRNKVGHGRLASLYQLKSGPFRLVVRDMETGKELGKAMVPRSMEGSYLDAFGVDGDDVIVAIDQALVVFDARDGSLRRDLETVQLPDRRTK